MSEHAGPSSDGEVVYECSVCLQSCIYPVRLPSCGHIFCYLCIKGVASRCSRCPMCRQSIPLDYLKDPPVLEQNADSPGVRSGSQWFYQGRQGGWWKYDARTNSDIEKAFRADDGTVEMLIAGHMYVVDFGHMCQYRKDQPSRKRKIKRDQGDPPGTKGVAGLTHLPSPSKDTEQTAKPTDD